MLYLRRFTFPNAEDESGFFIRSGKAKRTCYDSFYPFGILSARGLTELVFEPVTILYGGNGSGKTTALNVMADKLSLTRATLCNSSAFMADYLALCGAEHGSIPLRSRIITSDDVFDYMLNLRQLNERVSIRREEMFEEYTSAKRSNDFRLRSMEDYEELRRINQARSMTQSRYVRSRLVGEVREHSNGESAMQYFAGNISDDSLYLLDEPENSLSPEKQQELLRFLEESARFFGCQFVIATHSPFLLSMRGAKVYDLDAEPAAVRRWTELGAVRAYYDFFMAHRCEFQSGEDE